MRIRIILAGAVVLVLSRWGVRGKFLQPDVIILQEPVFGVVDINACSGVRCSKLHFCNELQIPEEKPTLASA